MAKWTFKRTSKKRETYQVEGIVKSKALKPPFHAEPSIEVSMIFDEKSFHVRPTEFHAATISAYVDAVDQVVITVEEVLVDYEQYEKVDPAQIRGTWQVEGLLVYPKPEREPDAATEFTLAIRLDADEEHLYHFIFSDGQLTDTFN